jgi:D-glycero-alpha-D-manno-heptose-7-phosphate kinase
VRHLPRFFDFETLLTYSKMEYINKTCDIQHPAIRNAMEMLDMQEIRLTYDSDLPAQSGLGTSSSFVVGMLNAFYALKGKYADKKRLADEAIRVERVLCAEAGGWQDQIAAAYGGLNRIDFGDEGYTVNPIIMPPERKKALNDNLLLYFTGFTRFSADIHKHKSGDSKENISALQEMLAATNVANGILTDKASDLDEFGRLMNQAWKLKKSLSPAISTDIIDDLYEKGIAAGALGGKILGAGGGGFLLFYVQQEYQEAVKKAMEDLLYIPFEFENEGSRVIHYTPETFTPKEDRLA